MSRRKPPVVTHNPDGWPDPHSRRLKLCNVQNLGGCAALPVWRVQRSGQGYIATAYFCDTDLPDEYRPLANTSPPYGPESADRQVKGTATPTAWRARLDAQRQRRQTERAAQLDAVDQAQRDFSPREALPTCGPMPTDISAADLIQRGRFREPHRGAVENPGASQFVIVKDV